MGEAVLLSICIPTYNQPGELDELLASISIEALDQVEIVICDESIDDASSRIVEKYINCLPIRYFKRERTGLDLALIFLVEEAIGEYIWWVGDDCLLPGAVDKVLNIVSSNPSLDFVWINSCDATDHEKRTWAVTDSRYFGSCDDVLELDIGLLAFITATVFKRSSAIECLGRASMHAGSALVCMYIILSVISREGDKYYLGEPCFVSNPKPAGEIRWYNQIQVFGINLPMITDEFRSNFSRRRYKAALSKNMLMVLRAIVYERAIGLSTGFADRRNFNSLKFIKIYWTFGYFWLFFPLTFLPLKILSLLYRFYAQLLKKSEI